MNFLKSAHIRNILIMLFVAASFMFFDLKEVAFVLIGITFCYLRFNLYQVSKDTQHAYDFDTYEVIKVSSI